MTRATRWGLPPGSDLGRYQILRGIARGGMGEVYLARMFVGEGDAHKLVAIKRILPHYLDDDALREMFHKEGKLALLLDHPHVVQIFDLAEIGGEHIIAMEYIHGRSAREILKDASGGSSVPREVAVAIVERIAAALHYVHQSRDPAGKALGLVHRDVSPENVMVRHDGGVKLIDFGIARMSAHTMTTRTNVLKGKLGYMSPEQLRQDPLDHRSDVFQLGVVLYELTTGVRLFEGENFAAVMNRVLEGVVEAPTAHNSSYPAELESIVLRALAFEPEDRFETAEALAEALAEFATAAGYRTTDAAIAEEMTRRFGKSTSPDLSDVAGPRTTVADTRPRSSGRWRRWAPVGLVGAAVVLATAGFVQRAAFADATTETELAHSWDRWLLLTGVSGERPRFTCDLNDQCNAGKDGICDLSTDACAYADPSCEAGYRRGAFGGPAANSCIDPDAPNVVIARRRSVSPQIDGEPAEFRRGPGVRLLSDFGVEARAWVAWDEHALYLAADVTDPNVETGEYERQELWHHDGVELLFDTARDRSQGRIPHADDFKFVITALNRIGTSWGGIIPTEAYDMPVESATRVDATVNQPSDQDNGYSIELAIPWNDTFRRPEIGQAWGFNVKVNDHHGPRHRHSVWRSEGKFNHPSSAGVLAFADAGPVQVAPPPERDVDDPPKYERVELATRVTATTPVFSSDTPVDNLFDGCLATREDCQAGVSDAVRMVVEFDLGQSRHFGFIRLFGDNTGDWVSTAWGLSTAQDRSGPWRELIDRANAYGSDWFTHDVRGASGRYLRMVVIGKPGSGTQATEFEVYALPEPKM